MKPRESKINPLFSDCVKPGGFIERLLVGIARSRKVLPAAYYRACKRIPKSSPVHGLTSWKRINDRRFDLIKNRVGRDPVEFEALQRVAGEVKAKHLIISNFLMGRKLRRLNTRKAA